MTDNFGYPGTYANDWRTRNHGGAGRKEKRFERKAGMHNGVQTAYYEGQVQAECRKPRPNPYPPGRRHDAYEHGLGVGYADLMGAHHGRNE